MTDAIRVSSPVTGTEKTLSFEAGKLAQQADGAVVARLGDTILLATVAAAKSVREGIDFFPLTVDIEERITPRARSRRVLPTRGPASRTRRPSPLASSTGRCAPRSRRVPQRGPRRRHDLQRRPGEPVRRPGDQRRLGRADDLGHPLRGPDRRRAHCLHRRRRVDTAPDLPRGRRRRPSSSSSPDARSARPPTPTSRS